MSGTDTAAMVPGIYDVVIDGFGYVTARAVDPNMPFRVQQQSLSYTPTFLERTNVGQGYGDDSQAFFLTASQNDWAGGCQQRFFHLNNPETRLRYWDDNAANIWIEGQVSMQPTITSVSFAGTILAATGGDGNAKNYVATSTNVYSVDAAGTIVDLGAHGAGTPSGPNALCVDSGNNLFLGGGTAFRKLPGGGAWGNFGAALGIPNVVFNNNTIYGLVGGGGGTGSTLYQFATDGTPIALFSWKDGLGNSVGINAGLATFGGKLLVSRADELWIWDGSGASLLARFPTNFYGLNICTNNGVIFVVGSLFTASTAKMETAVFYIANGQLGLLWRANATSTNTGFPQIGAFQGRVFWTDETNSRLMSYDPASGGISTIGSLGGAGDLHNSIAVGGRFILVTRDSSTGYLWPGTTAPSSAYVSGSLADFDNSLAKLMRGIKVDYSPATDGDGGSVDIAYQLDSLDGAYTSLQTAAVSGTEYALPGATTAHTISAKITLNKGTSAFGPTLKRVYIRGVPVQQSYRLNSLILDLGGKDKNPVRLRNDVDHHLTGEQMRANLAAAIAAQTPITITDPSGTYTGVPEPANCEFDITRPAQWYARISLRGV